MLEKSFFIYFNLPIEDSGKFICMEAVVEPDNSNSAYTIRSFRNFAGIKGPGQTANEGVLPNILIKKNPSSKVWVHVDSDQPSILSSVVGEAIENRRN